MEIREILECTSLQVFHKSLFGICCEQHKREREREKTSSTCILRVRSFEPLFTQLLYMLSRLPYWQSDWLTLNAIVIYLFAVARLKYVCSNADFCIYVNNKSIYSFVCRCSKNVIMNLLTLRLQLNQIQTLSAPFPLKKSNHPSFYQTRQIRNS